MRSPALFQILHKIRHRLPDPILIHYLFKIVSSEILQKISILVCDLTSMTVKAIILFLNKISGHCTFGNIQYTMKMQALLFRRTLPHTDILPTLPTA